MTTQIPINDACQVSFPVDCPNCGRFADSSVHLKVKATLVNQTRKRISWRTFKSSISVPMCKRCKLDRMIYMCIQECIGGPIAISLFLLMFVTPLIFLGEFGWPALGVIVIVFYLGWIAPLLYDVVVAYMDPLLARWYRNIIPKKAEAFESIIFVADTNKLPEILLGVQTRRYNHSYLDDYYFTSALFVRNDQWADRVRVIVKPLH